jgi:hypothetical protein
VARLKIDDQEISGLFCGFGLNECLGRYLFVLPFLRVPFGGSKNRTVDDRLVFRLLTVDDVIAGFRNHENLNPQSCECECYCRVLPH